MIKTGPILPDGVRSGYAAASIPFSLVQYAMPVPAEIHGQKYICLTTFRRAGAAVRTPVWFAEQGSKLYVKTRSDSGKYKRIRNNSQVQIASCTVRGKITGPEHTALARILKEEDWPRASMAIKRKYWLSRIPFLWSKKNVYLEIEVIE